MNTQGNSHQGQSLQELLTTHAPKKSLRGWLLLFVVAALVGGVFFYFQYSEEKTVAPRFKTETVIMDTLKVTVSATGNIQPTNKVDVGSELSGIIEEVFVDINDQVVKGQVLARLDLTKIKDTLAKSRANLAAAKAQLVQAQATVAEKKANIERMRMVHTLSGGKTPAVSELDSADAELKRAIASEAVAQASISQAQAVLQADETDLYKASIYSPIDGVVLDRQVEPGQTVAASFQAPVLFILAEDLTKMELQVDVDEADVGQVLEGQNATFTVDAWPGRRYQATITRVSYGSQVKDNVVSYATLLAVNNEDLSLRPGMTGTAEISTLTREDALLVPNAALRFSPPDLGADQSKNSRGMAGLFMPRPPRQPRQQAQKIDLQSPKVWILQDGEPKALNVRIGATNGRVTEVLEGELKAGTQVITETLGFGS